MLTCRESSPESFEIRVDAVRFSRSSDARRTGLECGAGQLDPRRFIRLPQEILVHTHWKAALSAAIVAGLTLSACSSNNSAPSPSSSSRRGGLKAISNCLSDHGADPTSLNGLLSGTPITATASQLGALRSAGRACESAVPVKQEKSLAATVTCLNGRGYHLDAGAPLESLFSLDLSRASVSAAVTKCAAASPARAPKSTGA
jgi:hypothetical protein